MCFPLCYFILNSHCLMRCVMQTNIRTKCKIPDKKNVLSIFDRFSIKMAFLNRFSFVGNHQPKIAEVKCIQKQEREKKYPKTVKNVGKNSIV